VSTSHQPEEPSMRDEDKGEQVPATEASASATPQRPDSDGALDAAGPSDTGESTPPSDTGPGLSSATPPPSSGPDFTKGATPPPPSGPGFATPTPPPPPGGPGFVTPPPAPPAAPGPAQPQAGVRYSVPQEQKNLALISTLGMLIVGFLSPLIVYVLTSGDPAKRFANDHAKEGLNFSIAFFAGWVIAFLLAFIIIGFLLMPFLAIWGLWVIIAGAIQANNGEAPHYPLVPKILK
jgi:uncharacterized Tic20 family protein